MKKARSKKQEKPKTSIKINQTKIKNQMNNQEVKKKK